MFRAGGAHAGGAHAGGAHMPGAHAGDASGRGRDNMPGLILDCSEFCNTLQSSINQLLDIQSCRVTRYRPSANGVVERSHATLNKLFATSVNENQRNWSDCLPYVAYAYNPAYHTSTTFTPFFLMFLREPRMGIDVVSETYTAAEFSSPEEYAHVMRERMQGAYRLVHDHLKAAFARAKLRYDVRVRECQFKVGDQVWYFSPRKYRHRYRNGHYKCRDRLRSCAV
jgi:hypothetical protein